MQGYNQQQRIHNEADEDEFTSLVNQQGRAYLSLPYAKKKMQ